MNDVELARRVREARELAGLSQQEVAERLSLPRTAVTQIEAGNRSISTMELTKLGELYRRPVGWFVGAVNDHDEDLLVALHRVAPGLERDPEVMGQVDQCVAICREGVSLEALLGREERLGPPAYRERVPRSAGDAVAQGEKVAEQERRRLGLGVTPIRDLPELISDQGIWASGTDLPDDMSGLFLRHPSIGMAVLVNIQHARARQRFSYAHEYAHALLDRDQTVGVTSAGNRTERIEQRANAFAAAFLLPADGVEEELHQLGKGQPSRTEQIVFDVATGGTIEGQLRPVPRSQIISFQDVAYIAQRFGVSYQAAVYRLKSLSHLNQGETADLLSSEQVNAGRKYLGELGLFDDLEAKVPRSRASRELRSRVAHLALEAYRREEISRGRLLDLSKVIGIPGRTLLDLAEAARTS